MNVNLFLATDSQIWGIIICESVAKKLTFQSIH